MAEVKQMLGTMKSGSHSNGIGEEELTLVEPIGKGGFGTVYKGKWRNLEVAVKMVVFAQFGPGGRTRVQCFLHSCSYHLMPLSRCCE